MNVINYIIVSTIVSVGHLYFNPDISEKIKSSAQDILPREGIFYQKDPFFNKVYFSKSDAEKILGGKAHLSDSSSIVKNDTLEIKKSYTANSKDQKSGKTGVIYFMIEEYKQLSSAKNTYNSIKVANENHKGIKTIHDMGDEAYIHSDGKNFYFILVRKEKILFRIKASKINNKTSLDEFKLISKKISDDL